MVHYETVTPISDLGHSLKNCSVFWKTFKAFKSCLKLKNFEGFPDNILDPVKYLRRSIFAKIVTTKSC